MSVTIVIPLDERLSGMRSEGGKLSIAFEQFCRDTHLESDICDVHRPRDLTGSISHEYPINREVSRQIEEFADSCKNMDQLDILRQGSVPYLTRRIATRRHWDRQRRKDPP